MKIIRKMSVVSVVGAVTSVSAAVLPIDGVTTTGDPLVDPNRDHVDLTSITVDGTTYSGLEGSTVSAAPGVGGSTTVFYAIDGSVPVDGNDAMSGLQITSSQAGQGNSHTGTTFQFGRTITQNDVMFFFEIGGNDSPTLTLVDTDDISLGATLTINENTDYGPGVANTLHDRTNGSGTPTFAPVGTSFLLSDFAGWDSLTSDPTGFRITTADFVDPTLAAITAVPEPTSLSLLLLCAGFFAVVRRNKGHGVDVEVAALGDG